MSNIAIAVPEHHSGGLGIRKGRLGCVNIGALYIATSAEYSGHSVAFLPPENSHEQIKKLTDIEVLGISTYPSTYENGISLANMAKEIGVPKVVFGGPYASTRGIQILNNHKQIDFVIVGHGEKTFLDLIENQPLESITGICYRQGNQVLYNPTKPIPMSDRVIPKREFYPGFPQESMSNTYFQDGCPFWKRPCIFCTIVHPSEMSRRTPEQVVEELAYLHQFRIRSIEEGGDDFASGGEQTVIWLNRIADLLKREKIEISWLIHASTRSLSYPGIISALAEIGVRTVQIGFESNEPSLKIHQKTTIELENEVIEDLRKQNIKIYGSWIAGMPGESKQSISNTIKQIRSLYDQEILAGVMLEPLWPGPGSPAFNLLPQFQERDWIDPMELMDSWFREYTQIDLDWFLKLREDLLKDVQPEIVGGMFL